MKILYDYQIFTNQIYGGISRYYYELIRVFNEKFDFDVGLPFQLSNNHYISTSDLVKHKPFFPKNKFKGKHKLQTVFNKYCGINKIKKNDFDVFHPTYYDRYFLNHIGNKPFVITVYDMIYEKFSETFKLNDNIADNKKLIVEKASKIIAISKSTKNDLIEIFGTDDKKIEVIHLGNSMQAPLSNGVFSIEPSNYILFVGSRSFYKNFNRFIHSISPLLVKESDLSIVCVGGGAFGSDELNIFNKLNITDKVFQFDINDEKLPYFYKEALVFVFPSLYEGFGIPILESFACNCPLVCSNTSSLSEIAGDAALLFDPYDEESIADTISKVIFNNDLGDLLRKKGQERLKQFSWVNTARKTKEVYEKLL